MVGIAILIGGIYTPFMGKDFTFLNVLSPSLFNTIFLIVAIHEAIFFYRQWKLNFSKSIRLEKDNLEAQYNALKAQVNPHFLFNSQNSLMSMLEGHPQAEKYVQDLSDYLRYVLLSNARAHEFRLWLDR